MPRFKVGDSPWQVPEALVAEVQARVGTGTGGLVGAVEDARLGRRPRGPLRPPFPPGSASLLSVLRSRAEDLSGLCANSDGDYS